MRYAETGYNLEIDLSRGNIERVETDPKDTQLFLGGLGTNAKILWERVPPEVDPFSPENVLIFAAGLLCGTPATGCNRTILSTISPQTGLMAFSMMGGFWAPELKYAGYDKVIYIGTNGKMSEVSAAMGLTSLESLDEFISINRSNYENYRKYLANIKGVDLFPFDETERCNYQYISLLIDESVTKVTRDQICNILKSENVLARRYFYPGCHSMEPYRSYYPHSSLLLPNTEQLSKQVLSLPTGSSVGESEIAQICQMIALALENAVKVRRRMGTARPENQ